MTSHCNIQYSATCLATMYARTCTCTCCIFNQHCFCDLHVYVPTDMILTQNNLTYFVQYLPCPYFTMQHCTIQLSPARYVTVFPLARVMHSHASTSSVLDIFTHTVVCDLSLNNNRNYHSSTEKHRSPNVMTKYTSFVHILTIKYAVQYMHNCQGFPRSIAAISYG